MSIRFAAARPTVRQRMTQGQAAAFSLRAANDNGARHARAEALHAALRHFALHGLSAARHAAQQAQEARRAGDEQGWQWWLEICRALDRRLAREVAGKGAGA